MFVGVDGTLYRTFAFDYEFLGGNFTVHIVARNATEARERLGAAAGGHPFLVTDIFEEATT